MSESALLSDQPIRDVLEEILQAIVYNEMIAEKWNMRLQPEKESKRMAETDELEHAHIKKIKHDNETCSDDCNCTISPKSIAVVHEVSEIADNSSNCHYEDKGAAVQNQSTPEDNTNHDEEIQETDNNNDINESHNPLENHGQNAKTSLSAETRTEIVTNTNTTKQLFTESSGSCDDAMEHSKSEKISHHLIGHTKLFEPGNFFKGLKWAPDGLCFLTSTNDKKVHLFNTPVQFLKNDWQDLSEPIALDACLKVQEPEIIYDFCWWPLMNSQDPATCCFVTSSRDQPVHLWDAFDGSLRASYIALSPVQEIQAANSVCFSPNGQQLLCGFKKEVCIFYTDRPGSECEKWKTGKKKHSQSQRNIISSVQFGPDETLFACACYDGSVGLYSPVNGCLLDFVNAHTTGVTHVSFSNDGNRLYTGARKSNSLKCWDLRNLQTCMFEMCREVDTNQRIYFDMINDYMEGCELKLASGSTTGEVHLWDVKDTINSFADMDLLQMDVKAKMLNPTYSFTAHNDCVNGCSVHPYLPIIATSSGQRKFPEPCGSDDEVDAMFKSNTIQENKVKLWLLENCFPKNAVTNNDTAV
ncbi:telomerase Cajal body protein 1-like [Clavelina lepadiformis]|uniref:telomerase Cajal body protein 1-like n=1 Tax=Clavelina lepadiformis TaxID=159417 RepID=UPI00404230F8